jgi:hypothetical protein
MASIILINDRKQLPWLRESISDDEKLVLCIETFREEEKFLHEFLEFLDEYEQETWTVYLRQKKPFSPDDICEFTKHLLQTHTNIHIQDTREKE